ncbi:hypothetical protein FGO68_gene13955 [Halteria grandinella]|uniref:Uncharacterized protein n=1 Tax=Halteria grandinella TaxID=5974 RepID=A0A8J8P1T3_HALGN|nr:hypothetical protein FGO68_gene13955 [Halteria grandinella]
MMESIFSIQGVESLKQQVVRKKTKSPLFTALKSRYQEVFPVQEPSEQASQESLDQIKVTFVPQINETLTQRAYGKKFFQDQMKNYTYVNTFKSTHSNKLNVISVDNEVESEMGMENPYFSRISLFELDYDNFIQPNISEVFNQDLTLLSSRIVPGLVIHSAIDQFTKDSFLVVYRILHEELGTLHRVRIFQNLTDGIQENHTFEMKDTNHIYVNGNQEEIGQERGFFKSIMKEREPKMRKTTYGRNYEDFPLPGAFQITAVNLANGSFTYSRIMDHYQYRIIKRAVDATTGKAFYQEVEKGPYIDRVKESKLWLCNGLRYLDMGGERPNLIVTAVQSNTSQYEVKATVEFHYHKKSVLGENNTNEEKTIPSSDWVKKQRVHSQVIPFHYLPNTYQIDAFQQHFGMTQFTQDDPHSLVVSLFGGQLYLSIDMNHNTFTLNEDTGKHSFSVDVYESFHLKQPIRNTSNSEDEEDSISQEETTDTSSNKGSSAKGKIVNSEWSLVSTAQDNTEYVVVKQMMIPRRYQEVYRVKPEIYLILREKVLTSKNTSQVKEEWISVPLDSIDGLDHEIFEQYVEQRVILGVHLDTTRISTIYPRINNRLLTLLFEGGTILTMRVDLPSSDSVESSWDSDLLDWLLFTLADDLFFDLFIPFAFVAVSLGSWLRRRRQRMQQERTQAENNRQMREIMERLRNIQLRDLGNRGANPVLQPVEPPEQQQAQNPVQDGNNPPQPRVEGDDEVESIHSDQSSEQLENNDNLPLLEDLGLGNAPDLNMEHLRAQDLQVALQLINEHHQRMDRLIHDEMLRQERMIEELEEQARVRREQAIEEAKNRDEEAKRAEGDAGNAENREGDAGSIHEEEKASSEVMVEEEEGKEENEKNESIDDRQAEKVEDYEAQDEASIPPLQVEEGKVEAEQVNEQEEISEEQE